MKLLLVIDVADDVAEAYEDFTVDYNLFGTPKEDPSFNENIRYVEDCPLRPLPQKMTVDEDYRSIMWWDDDCDTAYSCGYNGCLYDILGEEE